MSAACSIPTGLIVAAALFLLVFTRRRNQRRRVRLACSTALVLFMLYTLTGSVYVLTRKLDQISSDEPITKWDQDDVIDLALWPVRLLTGK